MRDFDLVEELFTQNRVQRFELGADQIHLQGHAVLAFGKGADRVPELRFDRAMSRQDAFDPVQLFLVTVLESVKNGDV